jgi:hypothetical protein
MLLLLLLIGFGECCRIIAVSSFRVSPPFNIADIDQRCEDEFNGMGDGSKFQVRYDADCH